MLEKLLKERTEFILNLPKNWDDNDADTFTAETLERTCQLLKTIFEELWNHMLDVPFPLISPLPDGSIDINWETESFELLINISSAQNGDLINLYGERMNHPEDEIDLRINYEMVAQSIIPWLLKVIS